jgi:outer membrane protein OmpA-like peptidoglycan-associated protein
MSKSSAAHWIPLSDLMTGLMLIFLMISVVFMLRVEQTTTLVVQELEKTKKDLVMALQSEFKNDLKKWDAEILGDMTIRFKNPDALFKKGESKMTETFKTTLNEFLPRYLKIITSDKFAPSIKEVLIEGHTSPSYDEIDKQYVKMTVSEKVKKYLSNMDIAQDRTNVTNQYLYEIESCKPYHELMIQKVHLHDVSSSYPIYKEDHSIDEQLSQRVEFKIVTNASEKMEQIAKDLQN